MTSKFKNTFEIESISEYPQNDIMLNSYKGKDLIILYVVNSLGKLRLSHTMKNISNFEMFSTNGYSIGITHFHFLEVYPIKLLIEITNIEC